MRLRRFKEKDASLMLEWMHDQSVVENLHSDFASKNINDCKRFIKNSFNNSTKNFAIVSDSDEYMGTVSLKRIDRNNLTAEFAIAIRKSAMGRGYSWYAMQEIIKYAFETEHLNLVYWCVSKDNLRACRFYDKHHFNELYDIPCNALEAYADISNLKWYVVNKKDYYSQKELNEILGCKIINIKTIETEGVGKLSYFESGLDCIDQIKRIYYIYSVPEGIRRGFHAHKNLKQLVFCPYGKVNFVLDNGTQREEILLDDPSIGVLIEKPIWREMVWMQKDSILCVAASENYDSEDYIRDYREFLKYINDKG